MKYLKTTCIALSLFVSLAACSTQQDEQESVIAGQYFVLPATNENPEQLDFKFLDGSCHVRTMVRSRGQGIDRTLIISLFEHQNYFTTIPIIDFYIQEWGREGEVAMCSQVHNPNNRTALIQELSDILANHTLKGTATFDHN